MSTDIDSRRKAAQADFRRAADSIDALFDAKSALVLALDAVAAAAGGPDPLRAALDVDDLLARVHDSVAVVQTAALEAAGVPVTFQLLEGHVHPSFAFTRLLPSAGAYEKAAIAALARAFAAR